MTTKPKPKAIDPSEVMPPEPKVAPKGSLNQIIWIAVAGLVGVASMYAAGEMNFDGEVTASAVMVFVYAGLRRGVQILSKELPEDSWLRKLS